MPFNTTLAARVAESTMSAAAASHGRPAARAGAGQAAPVRCACPCGCKDWRECPDGLCHPCSRRAFAHQGSCKSRLAR